MKKNWDCFWRKRGVGAGQAGRAWAMHATYEEASEQFFGVLGWGGACVEHLKSER